MTVRLLIDTLPNLRMCVNIGEREKGSELDYYINRRITGSTFSHITTIWIRDILLYYINGFVTI